MRNALTGYPWQRRLPRLPLWVADGLSGTNLHRGGVTSLSDNKPWPPEATGQTEVRTLWNKVEATAGPPGSKSRPGHLLAGL